MTAHNHAEIVKTKADNMELVLFAQSKGGETYGKWTECNKDTLPKNSEFCNYFLCLPKFKDQCSDWLNGIEVEYKVIQSVPNNEWYDLSAYNDGDWSIGHAFMSDMYEFRVKPRKEKRWIAVKRNDEQQVYAVTFDSLEQAQYDLNVR